MKDWTSASFRASSTLRACARRARPPCTSARASGKITSIPALSKTTPGARENGLLVGFYHYITCARRSRRRSRGALLRRAAPRQAGRPPAGDGLRAVRRPERRPDQRNRPRVSRYGHGRKRKTGDHLHRRVARAARCGTPRWRRTTRCGPPNTARRFRNSTTSGPAGPASSTPIAAAWTESPETSISTASRRPSCRTTPRPSPARPRRSRPPARS